MQADSDLVFDSLDSRNSKKSTSEGHNGDGWVSNTLERVKRQLFDFWGGSSTEAPQELSATEHDVRIIRKIVSNNNLQFLNKILLKRRFEEYKNTR